MGRAFLCAGLWIRSGLYWHFGSYAAFSSEDQRGNECHYETNRKRLADKDDSGAEQRLIQHHFHAFEFLPLLGELVRRCARSASFLNHVVRVLVSKIRQEVVINELPAHD